MTTTYEYKFVRIGEYAGSALFGVRDKERNAYESIVHDHAREGWRLVQIFAPGVAAFGAAKYYELIFEREASACDAFYDPRGPGVCTALISTPRPNLASMQFSPELRDGVASGRITLSFRLWQRPMVKVGSQYARGAVRIEIDSIEMVPFSSVTPADVRRSGEKNRETLRQRAAHAGPIDDDTLVYRIEFHVVP